MIKAKPSLAAAVLALALLFQPVSGRAQSFAYPPNPVAWVAAQGYSGFSGIPWPGPPWASPIRTPSYGCYVSRTRLKLMGAFRSIEVCY
jgi:hypothetical protein